MEIENEIPPFIEWLPGAAGTWLAAVGALVALALTIGLVLSVLRVGPGAGVRQVLRVLLAALEDMVRISPRRVLAMACLAFKEAIRRRVVVGFGVFILILLFAGWFLDPRSINPARLYLGFVLTTTTYLVLLLALFLSAFSLPTDIKNKTIFTVVTKPVRASEIVLGRMLGFSAIGTMLLLVMCVLSYLFVVRGLAHSHKLGPDDLTPVGQVAAGSGRALEGSTSTAMAHHHEVRIDASGVGALAAERGHWHELETTGSGDEAKYRVGAHRGMLVARVPVYAQLAFRDKGGLDALSGISVGDEWTYRSYIEGMTSAAAIWTFEDIDEKQFSAGLPLEMTIGIFRSHKGDMAKGVLGSLSLRNPKTGLTIEVEIFEAKEFIENEFFIPRSIDTFASAQVVTRRVRTSAGLEVTPTAETADPMAAEKTEFDLFEDLVSEGKLEVWLRCLDTQQYFGVAQPDLYLRAHDAPFWWNFAKSYFGIWLQMVLVVGFGVMFSTFLSGPVAMIATLGTLVGGFFSQFMTQLGQGQVLGGGSVEAMVRLLTHNNLTTKLDPGMGTSLVKGTDWLMQFGLQGMSSVLPAFADFSYTQYVAYGFDISGNLLLIRTITALAYMIPVFVAGYIFLKTREVAK